MERLHQAGKAAEFIGVISFFVAVMALFVGPVLAVNISATLEKYPAVLIISFVVLVAMTLFILMMLMVGPALNRQRRAHLYETFGLEQTQRPTPAELVALYQKPRRRFRWLRRR